MDSIALWSGVVAGAICVCLGFVLSWRLPGTSDRALPVLALAAIMFLLMGTAILVRGLGQM
jgi:hypothetical protein